MAVALIKPTSGDGNQPFTTEHRIRICRGRGRGVSVINDPLSDLSQVVDQMAEDSPTIHMLEMQILRQLATPPDDPVEVIEATALGTAHHVRFGRILTGQVGRDHLIRTVTRAQSVLDEGISAPAPWRGPSRKDCEAEQPVNAPWLNAAFEAAAQPQRGRPLTFDDLIRINRIVGGTGELRRGTIRVDGYQVPFAPKVAVEVAETHLSRADAAGEPAALVAARLHLGILLAHPFRDGNGRTARAAAGAVLLAGGMRSSLLTCVEQHYHAVPNRYRAILGQYRAGAASIDDVIDDLLGAMATRCLLATWVRERCRLIVESFASSGHPPLEAALAFDRGEILRDDPMTDRLEPWSRLQPHLHPLVARELKSQLGRVLSDR